MLRVVLLCVAILQLGFVSAACPAWDGSPIYSGTQLQVYSPAINAWVGYANLPIGSNPAGLIFQSTPVTFTLNNVGPFTYGGVGQQGAFTGPNGAVYNCDYGGNYVTVVNSGRSPTWNIAVVPNGAAPNIRLWDSQIGAQWGYQLGIQVVNTVTVLGLNQPNPDFQLFVCYAPPPTSAPTPPPTQSPSQPSPWGCLPWTGNTIYSGTQLEVYSPAANAWLNYGPLPIGTNPAGLVFKPTAANFTLNNVGPFTYGGTGQQGALSSPDGAVYNCDYGGNYVCVVNNGRSPTWNIAIVPNGAPPNIFLWDSQIGANWGYKLGLQPVNGQTLLGLNQPNFNFQLYICYAPTPTLPPTPPPTQSPSQPSPWGCSPWSGSALTSGARLEVYSPYANAWLNYGPLPIGTNPAGLVFKPTAANFTLNNVGPFTYGGTGQQGALSSPDGAVYNCDYGGNYVCVVNNGRSPTWNIAIVPNGAAPNIFLWDSQIGANWGYKLGLQPVNGQTLLGLNQPNFNFQLFVC